MSTTEDVDGLYSVRRDDRGLVLTPLSYAAYLTGRLAALGLSRNALARALGHRGASQVSRWCAGKAVPREKAQSAVQAALNRLAYERYRTDPAVFATDMLGVGLEPWQVDALRVVASNLVQTPQDAPGSPIPGGEAPEGTPFVVERYVVEGG